MQRWHISCTLQIQSLVSNDTLPAGAETRSLAQGSSRLLLQRTAGSLLSHGNTVSIHNRGFIFLTPVSAHQWDSTVTRLYFLEFRTTDELKNRETKQTAPWGTELTPLCFKLALCRLTALACFAIETSSLQVGLGTSPNSWSVSLQFQHSPQYTTGRAMFEGMVLLSLMLVYIRSDLARCIGANGVAPNL